MFSGKTPFDFNHDGKTDLSEYYLAYNIYEDCTKEESNDDLDYNEDDLDDNYTPIRSSRYNSNNTEKILERIKREKELKKEKEKDERYKTPENRYIGERAWGIFELIFYAVIVALMLIIPLFLFILSIEGELTPFTIILMFIIVPLFKYGFYDQLIRISGEIKKEQALLKKRIGYEKSEALFSQCRKKTTKNFVIFALCIICIFSIKPARYYCAVAAYDCGNYKIAMSTFEKYSYKDYKNAKEYYNFCNAKKAYDEKEYSLAYSYLKDIKPNFLRGKRLVAYNEFFNDVKKKHDEKWDKIYKNNLKNKERETEQKTTKVEETTTAYKIPKYYYTPSDDEDKYDVDKFHNPEDFYDYYYDNFIDYYEAEDYYNEHR